MVGVNKPALQTTRQLPPYRRLAGPRHAYEIDISARIHVPIVSVQMQKAGGTGPLRRGVPLLPLRQGIRDDTWRDEHQQFGTCPATRLGLEQKTDIR